MGMVEAQGWVGEAELHSHLGRSREPWGGVGGGAGALKHVESTLGAALLPAGKLPELAGCQEGVSLCA